MDKPISSTRRLTVSDVKVLETEGDCYQVEFSLDWREAFRAGDRWNAAWVFLKVKSSETVEVDSNEGAVTTLTGTNDVTSTEAVAFERLVKHQIPRLLANFPGLPGKPPFSRPNMPSPPPPPPLLRGLAAKARGPLGAGPGLPAGGGALEQGSAKEAPLPYLLRLAHQHIEQGAQDVEVENDFALLAPGQDGAKSTITTFTSWQHMMVATDAQDHWATGSTVITPSEDGMGVFVYRSENDTSENDRSEKGRSGALKLKLRLKTQRPCDGHPLKVWVGAIEMVHIPAGEFRLGDPAGPEGPHCCFHTNGEGDDLSYPVRSEGPIEVGIEPGQLTWNNKGQMGKLGDLPATFPKGHQGYYVTKHLISQGEYADFINHLKGHQLSIRFPFGGQGEYRYTVYKTRSSARVCTRPERPANWVSWADASAYMWWTGLRPLTELEWEKAARGPLTPVSCEYAWGSTVLVSSVVILGDETEHPIVQGNANIENTLMPFHGGDGGQGPVPDDAFRATCYQCEAEAVHLGEGSDVRDIVDPREETGASYYGVMGMTGNLWEFVISAGMAKGRAFVGEHGGGELNPQGGLGSTESSWPDHDNVGIGYRGGSWYTKAYAGRIADRCFGSGLTGYYDRSHDTGIRAARTAPKP